jgi:error-prone DNA polymerase
MREDIHSDKALRLGFASIAGLKEAHIETIVARRGDGYRSIRDLWLRTGLAPAVLEKLAEADAFAESLGLSRRDALWAIKGLIGTDGAETLSLFAAAGLPAPSRDEQTDLPAMAPGEAVIADYKALGLSLQGHPVQFLREKLARGGIIAAAGLAEARPGSLVEVAGLVLVRQRPGTASGLIFLTLEDETGIANIVVWNRIFEANRRTVLGARLVSVRGEVQREGLVVHVIARAFRDFTPDLMALARGEGEKPLNRLELDRAARAALPSGRNFH